MKPISQCVQFGVLAAGAVFFLGGNGPAIGAQDADKKQAERIQTLIKVFEHPEAQAENLDETVAAIKELTAIGTQAVPQLMEAILGKNQVVAAYSANALDYIGAPAMDLVRGKWIQLDEIQKWKLMRFRGKFDYVASLEFALASLESKQETVRRQAIEYAGQHKEAKARRTLLKMLNTEVPEQHRWIVIENLAGIGNDDEVADALIALLANDSWASKGKGLVLHGFHAPWRPDGRDFVIAALGKMGARKAAPRLLEIVQEKEPNKGFYFNNEIATLFGEWNYKDGIPELKRLMVSKHEWCSPQNVARVLLQLKDRAGMPLLLERLKSNDARDREFACKALARYGDITDVVLLGSCLADMDFDVQFVACEGLERITGVINRAQGQTMLTSADIPLWRDWFDRNKAKYQSGK